MTRPTYFVAKFIPDLILNEPRNVGVILWTPKDVSARFLGEAGDPDRHMDGRSLRGFESSASFRQWVDYLRGQFGRPFVLDPQTGDRVPRSSQSFLSAISAQLNESFSIVEAGFFVEELAQGEVIQALDHLFSKFVRIKPNRLNHTIISRRGRTQTETSSAFRDILSRTGVVNSPYLHEKKRLSCSIKGKIEEELEFSYAFENGSLHRLFQIVELPVTADLLGKNIHDVAWKFERVIESGFIKQNGAVAVLLADKLKLEEPKVSRGIQILSSIGQVLNLADDYFATQQIAQLPTLSEH